MSNEQKESLKNKIIEHIYNAILNDEYKRAEQIKEIPLSQKLNVSRAPVREAMAELVSLGILEQIERRGVFVKEISSKDIFDTYESKGVIEGFLATSFALHASADDMKTLDEYINQMAKNGADKNAVAKIGGDFHEHYLKYATNDVLKQTLKRLNKKSQLLFSRNWSKLYTMDEIILRHQKIVDVLKAKKKKQIETCIKEHYFETGTKIVLLHN